MGRIFPKTIFFKIPRNFPRKFQKSKNEKIIENPLKIDFSIFEKFRENFRKIFEKFSLREKYSYFCVDEYFLDWELPDDMSDDEFEKLVAQFDGFLKGWEKKYKEGNSKRRGKKRG